MDYRELHESDDEAFHSLVEKVKSTLFFALPVIVEKDCEDGHKVTLKSAIKGRKIDEKGKVEYVDMPLFEDAPINFASGGGATFTHPIKKGDEGLFIVSSRAFDAWRQSGGTQKAPYTRIGSLSDGFYIPGIRSDPRKIKTYSKDSVQLRSDDGKHFIDLHPTNGAVTVSVDEGKHTMSVSKDTGIKHKSSVKVEIDTPKTVLTTGSLKVQGVIESVTGLKAPLISALPGDPGSA